MSNIEPAIPNNLESLATSADKALFANMKSGQEVVDCSRRPEFLHARIVIIDDDPSVSELVELCLSQEGYQNLLVVHDSSDAIEQIDAFNADVVLSDLMMPNVNGLDLLKLRKQHPTCQHIPFIILSGNTDAFTKQEALELGANDFLSKPIDSVDLLLRVRNTILIKQHQNDLRNYASDLESQVRERTQQLEISREKVVHCLARAAEFRDNETGSHVIRVGKYAAVIAGQLGFDNSYCKKIELAAQLHDVGKIGIPDSILLNPGRLSSEEFAVMKEHCQLGYKIMEPLAQAESSHLKRNVRGQFMTGWDAPLLGLAANIALTHHEKWDGTGYPTGLRREEIPIEGRITCVADVYDALCSERPYKPSFPREKCLEIMLSERGTRFDPEVLDVFFERLDMIIAIGEEHQDQVDSVVPQFVFERGF